MPDVCFCCFADFYVHSGITMIILIGIYSWLGSWVHSLLLIFFHSPHYMLYPILAHVVLESVKNATINLDISSIIQA